MEKKQKRIPAKKGMIKTLSGSSPSEWIYRFWAWQLLVWAIYRYGFSLPETTDEFVAKPLIFVAPVVWYVVKKEKRTLQSIGLSVRTNWKHVLLGLGFGLLFAGEAIMANILKYGTLQISPTKVFETYGLPLLFLLSFATACSEELLSRGFLFSRLFEATKKLWYSAIMSSLLFVAFHIPILLTTLRFSGPTLILFFCMNIALGVANSMVYHRTMSLVAPILIHLFWNMTVAVFL